MRIAYIKAWDEIESKTKRGEFYDAFVELDGEGNIINWGCTCIFGSVFRFSRRAIEKNIICKHVLKLAEKVRKIISKVENDEKTN